MQNVLHIRDVFNNAKLVHGKKSTEGKGWCECRVLKRRFQTSKKYVLKW